MRWIPILLAASLLTLVVPAQATANPECYGVHDGRGDVATACYHGQTCTSGQVRGHLAWQPAPNCDDTSIGPDFLAEPPCFGVMTSKGLTGTCQTINCHYGYVMGTFVEKICWV